MTEAFVQDHRDYLLRELKVRTQRRPFYSQRAFARDLGISPGAITDFLNGKLKLSKPRILTLGKKLNLTMDQIEHWNDLLENKFSRNEESKKLAQIKIKNRMEAQKNSISLDRFRFISEWHHSAFLELLNMNSKKYSQVPVAAKALGISPKVLKDAIKRLKILGLIAEQSGSYEVLKNVNIQGGVPSSAVRKFHADILQKASKALETQKVDERYNDTAVFRVPKEKIPQLREEVRKLTSDVLDKCFDKDHPKNDQLYCFTVHFFNLLGKES